MSRSKKTGIFFAILAAALYAISTPLSKILLDYMPSTLIAGFLYIGAGIGMGGIAIVQKAKKKQQIEARLTWLEFPYTIAMIVLDIIAPICLLLGLKFTTAASASLLNNFEIVATALIASVIFKERITHRLWIGIIFITLSCALLSLEDISSIRFSYGSCFILLACICWGFENNCTRKISSKNPLQIVLLKGIFSGIGSILIGLCIGERITFFWSIFVVMIVGFISYGLSIFFMYMRSVCLALQGQVRIMLLHHLSELLYPLLFFVNSHILHTLYHLALWVLGHGCVQKMNQFSKEESVKQRIKSINSVKRKFFAQFIIKH